MHLIAIVAVLAIKLISYLRGAKMADWNSSQYLKFKNQRTQPAVDLAMRMINRKPKKSRTLAVDRETALQCLSLFS